MFQKKIIHKYTWQYPGRKQWHCIDCDYEVEAETNVVDHKLLIGQLKVHFPVKISKITMRRRFAVGALKEDKVQETL